MNNTPKISLIVAMTPEGVIGRDNDLPWRIPADLKHFKAMTMGKSMIMGRRNFESIGRPLPGRTSIILTRDPDYRAEGCRVVHSVDDAISAAEGPEIMVIGGAEIYRLFLPLASTIYLTRVHADVPGDVHFPTVDWSQWRLVAKSQHTPGHDSPYRLDFETWNRP